MGYQKIKNLLNKTQNQPIKFRTKKWIERNARGTYNFNSQIKFKTSILRSRLCNYSDRYNLVIGTIGVNELVASRGNNNIQVAFKSCAPFTNCISEINNT